MAGLKDQSAIRVVLYALLLIAVFLRFDVFRKIDGSGELWRECDVGAIARNFYREGMNIFYPRIDWRGDGPGYVESEFPLYAWGVAVLYKVFGYHEELARGLSFAFSALSCFVVLRLSLLLLPPAGAIVAMAVFAANPIAFRLGSAVQAEPLMFAAYVSGIYLFLRWLESGSKGTYFAALAATTLAVLAKITALHVGILYAALCIERYGWRALARWELYAFAAGVLAPTILWYAHARSLWVQYGNSLGISNESYLRITSLSFLNAAAATIPGVVRIELSAVWTVPGCVLGFLGLLRTVWSRPHRPLLCWLLALACFYVLTGRTTGEVWATYYHIVSAPCAALLMGVAISWILEREAPEMSGGLLPLAAGSAGLVLVAAGLRKGLPLDAYNAYSAGAGALLLGLALAAFLLERFHAGKSCSSPPESRTLFRRASAAAALLVGAVIALEARKVGAYSAVRGSHPLYDCAQRFQTFVPPGTLIAATGLGRLDRYGLPQAFDAPYIFFWMDRKGFTLFGEDQSVERLRDLRRRGARFFAAEKPKLSSKAGFEDEARRTFRVVAECGGTVLFSLEEAP